MRFRLTQHALARQAEYGIADEWIALVLDAPGRLDGDPDDSALTIASAPIEDMDRRVLRVVYNHEESPPLVVTFFFDRRMRGER